MGHVPYVGWVTHSRVTAMTRFAFVKKEKKKNLKTKQTQINKWEWFGHPQIDKWGWPKNYPWMVWEWLNHPHLAELGMKNHPHSPYCGLVTLIWLD
jgi:hypothetical protein